MDVTPKFGDRVRVQCSATGRYVSDGWALVVSAQDNELFLDRAVAGEPHPTLPAPSDDALDAAAAGYRAGREAAARAIERPGSVLCDCPADSPPTNPATAVGMDHHCDCRAVEAAALMLGAYSETQHARQCVHGTEMDEPTSLGSSASGEESDSG